MPRKISAPAIEFRATTPNGQRRDMDAHSVSTRTETISLTTRRLKLETQQEPIVLMHVDCPIARSEGFLARAQVELHANGRTAVATLYQVSDSLIGIHEVGLSEVVWRRLQAKDGAPVTVRHPQPLRSMSDVRSKIYGHRLDDAQLHSILHDVAAEHYSDVQLAAFITAFSSQPVDVEEVVGLTEAMVDVGERLSWPGELIIDKHCVGGLPANRTTPLVVAIAASAGLTIPKTSSRAITSPAGTADAMETITRVDLDTTAMRRVVEKEGGCIVWGGSVRLSPADDILIRVEKALDVDNSAQLVASVLSKKIAAGSTHVVIDIPVGATAKVRSDDDALALAGYLEQAGAALGLHVRPIRTDGLQPIGSGIGPALEAKDVLAVLRCEPEAPADLREKGILLGGAILEMGGAAKSGGGADLARSIVEDGRALAKFQAICEAQGAFREPPTAPLHDVVSATMQGRVSSINNRLIAKVAKLAGAPAAKAAGVTLHVEVGDRVEKHQPLITVHAQSPGEMEYALAFARANTDTIEIEEH
jgi:thymidine phosphorylase